MTCLDALPSPPPGGGLRRARAGEVVLAGPGVVPDLVALGGVEGEIGVAEVGAGHDGEVGAAGG